jgi:hypothetical protein
MRLEKSGSEPRDHGRSRARSVPTESRREPARSSRAGTPGPAGVEARIPAADFRAGVFGRGTASRPGAALGMLRKAVRPAQDAQRESTRTAPAKGARFRPRTAASADPALARIVGAGPGPRTGSSLGSLPRPADAGEAAREAVALLSAAKLRRCRAPPPSAGRWLRWRCGFTGPRRSRSATAQRRPGGASGRGLPCIRRLGPESLAHAGMTGVRGGGGWAGILRADGSSCQKKLRRSGRWG